LNQPTTTKQFEIAFDLLEVLEFEHAVGDSPSAFAGYVIAVDSDLIAQTLYDIDHHETLPGPICDNDNNQE